MPVNIIDTLKPKNGLNFPVVEAIDVFVEDYENLADAISHFATDAMIEAINAVLSGKANTSDVNTAVSGLQAQIDQIAQTAGTGTADTEIGQARVGADGTSYLTLKSRIDTEVTELAEGINSFKKDYAASSFTAGTGSTDTEYKLISGNTYHFKNTGAGNTVVRVKDSDGYTNINNVNSGTEANYTAPKSGILNFYCNGAGTTVVVDNTNDVNYKTSKIYAQIPTIEAEISALETAAEEIPDKYDDNTLIDGFEKNFAFSLDNIGYINTSGVVKPSLAGQWQYSDRISVTEGQTITYSLYGASTVASISFYDNNGGIITSASVIASTTGTISGEVNAPENAKTVVVCNSIADYADGYATTEGEMNIPESLTYLKSYTDRISSKYDDSTLIEGFDKSVSFAFSNVGYVKLDGSIGTSKSGQWQYSDKISVSPGQTIEFSVYGATNVASVSFYDDADNIIAESSVVAETAGVFEDEVTAPANAKTAVVCNMIAQYRNGYATSEGEMNIPEALNYLKDTSDISGSFWKGKKIGFLGDSITRGTYTKTDGTGMAITDHPYWAEVGEVLGATTVGYGVNGTSISATSTEAPSNAFVNRYSSMANDLDLVVVLGGTNDYAENNGVQLGTAADTTDISFYGAMDVLCNGLINKYPDKRIVFITPLLRNYNGDHEAANDRGFTLEQVRQAIVDVAQNRYGLAVINGKNLGISPYNSTWKATYIYDGLHPNPEGHIMVGKNLAHILNSI